MPHDPEGHRHAWWETLLKPVELSNKQQVKEMFAMLVGEPAAAAMDAAGVFANLMNSAQPLADNLQAQAGVLLKSVFDFLDQTRNK